MPLRSGLPTRVCLQVEGRGESGGSRLLTACQQQQQCRCTAKPAPCSPPAVVQAAGLDDLLNARHPLVHARAGRQAQLRGGRRRRGG